MMIRSVGGRRSWRGRSEGLLDLRRIRLEMRDAMGWGNRSLKAHPDRPAAASARRGLHMGGHARPSLASLRDILLVSPGRKKAVGQLS
jgi:hypothetical protein